MEITVFVKHSTDPILARAVVGKNILVQHFACEKIEVCILLFHVQVFHLWLQKYPMQLLHKYCDVLSLQKLSTHAPSP